MVALEEAAAAAADGCADVEGFSYLPTAATLGCQSDGTVAPVARTLLVHFLAVLASLPFVLIPADCMPTYSLQPWRTCSLMLTASASAPTPQQLSR